MKKFYIDVNGRAFGPFAVDVLQGMIDKGKLTPESRVSYNRLDWISAGECPELFAPEQTSNGLELASYDAAPSYSYDDRVWMLVQVGVAEYGPYAGSEIIAALQDGRITPDFAVRRETEATPRLIRDEPMFARACGGAVGGASDVASGNASSTGRRGARDWYFSLDGATANGPYTVDEILDFVRQGRATIDAIVWRDGDDNSRPMTKDPTLGPLARALYRRDNPTSSAPVASFAGGASYGRPSSSQNYVGASAYSGGGYGGGLSDFYARLTKRVARSYRAIWICGLVGLVLAFLGAGAVSTTEVFFASSGWIVLGTLAAFVSLLIFIFAVWSGMPREYVQSSPWLAISLLFVPLFNFYWIFHVAIRAAKSLNELLTQYSSVGARHGDYPLYAKTVHAVFFSIACVIVYGFYFCGPFAIGVNVVKLSRGEDAETAALGLLLLSVVVSSIGIAAICLFLASIKRAAAQYFAWSSLNAAEYENASERPVTLDDVLRG